VFAPKANTFCKCFGVQHIVHVCDFFFPLYISPGDVAGQFTAPPPTCPGDTFTFTCTVSGDVNGVTVWRVGSGTSDCFLGHSDASASSSCGPGSAFMAAAGTGFGDNVTSFTATLTGTATPTLDGTRVQCFPGLNRDPGNEVGDSNLQIIGMYIPL